MSFGLLPDEICQLQVSILVFLSYRLRIVRLFMHARPLTGICRLDLTSLICNGFLDRLNPLRTTWSGA